MASSHPTEGKLLQYLEEQILKCSVCSDQFTDPKTLSCHHTFCGKCIGERIDKCQNREPFECPVCGTHQVIPKGGVVDLDAGVVIKSLLEAAAVFRNTAISCTFCVQNTKALSACYTCGDFFCVDCKRHHDNLRINQKHITCHIEELKRVGNLVKFQRSRFNFCDEHPGEMKKLYCEVHDVDICTVCSFEGVHKTHTQSISTLASKVTQVKEEIKRDTVRFEQAASDLKKRESEMLAIRSQLDRKEKEDLEKLEESLQFVLKLVQNYARDIRNTISNVYMERKSAVDLERERLKIERGGIESVLRAASIMDALPLGHVLEASKEVKANLRNTTKKMEACDKENEKTTSLQTPLRYIGPVFNKAMNKSLEQITLGRVESSRQVSERILYSSGLSEDETKDMTSAISRACLSRAREGLSFSAFGGISKAIRKDMEQKHGGHWSCVVGTAECYHSDMQIPNSTFLFVAWGQIYVTLAQVKSI